MKFLGESALKKLIALIKGDLANKADKNHIHNYAGSSSAGGAATSANKLNTNAGSATNPVYFKDGVPVKTTYTLEKSVPSDAKFTDTVTEVDDTLSDASTNPVQNKAIKTALDGKADTADLANKQDKITVSGLLKGDGNGGISAVTVDSAIDSTSENPVQNKAIKTYVDKNRVGKKIDTNGAEIFNDYALNVASGDYSHAEGVNTTASGDYSHAEGVNTTASGNYSHAQNCSTTAAHESQTAIGKYNNNKADTLLEVGNGTAEVGSNAFEVYTDGHAEVQTMGTTERSLTTKKYVDDRIPAATTTNNGQFLRVVNGVPTWVALTNVAEEGA